MLSGAARHVIADRRIFPWAYSLKALAISRSTLITAYVLGAATVPAVAIPDRGLDIQCVLHVLIVMMKVF